LICCAFSISPKKATAAAERSRFFIKFRNCLPISMKSELNVTKFIEKYDHLGEFPEIKSEYIGDRY
jgi:hypothetical protein